MGLPVREDSSGSLASASASAREASSNGNVPDSVHHVFVYGNSRPDITPAVAGEGAHTKRAWLLGSRLYSCNTGGVQRAAVRLEEAGHAVLGYTVSLGSLNGVGRLLDTFERREYSPDYYERDVVEVESLSMMLRAKESMRTYLKGPTSGPLVEFSDRQHLSEDTGDGDGLAVFSALSLSTHEMLAEELINMFLSEIRIKWLIVSELHSLLYSEKVDDHLRKQTSEKMMHNIFLETNLKIPGIIFEEQEHDVARTVQQGSGVKAKREVLQVYLTAWLAEVNLKKSRKDEVLRSVSEEIQFSLSG